MAIVQISKIQVKTGNIADLPQLSVGEFGWASDTKQLFIGNEPNVVGPIPDNTEILTALNGCAAAGNTTEIQFNTNDLLDASPNLTWDNTSATQTIIGQLVANTSTATDGFRMNSSGISTGAYTITPTYNAMTAGPFTLSGSASITALPGSRWVIV